MVYEALLFPFAVVFSPCSLHRRAVSNSPGTLSRLPRSSRRSMVWRHARIKQLTNLSTVPTVSTVGNRTEVEVAEMQALPPSRGSQISGPTVERCCRYRIGRYRIG